MKPKRTGAHGSGRSAAADHGAGPALARIEPLGFGSNNVGLYRVRKYGLNGIMGKKLETTI